MYLLTSPHHWTTTLQSKLQLQLHLDMWVWTNFLEKSRHTHNMERSICGLRPTVLSANLYQSYPISRPQNSKKWSPESIYTKCSPSLTNLTTFKSFCFSCSQFLFSSSQMVFVNCIKCSFSKFFKVCLLNSSKLP